MTGGSRTVGFERVMTMEAYLALGGFEGAWKYAAQGAGIDVERIQGVSARLLPNGDLPPSVRLTIDLRRT